ncbi:MAG TPA: zf-HC2 domain-containing protein [Dehalococcoidia bacterium]|nr:zf-HC2 domain-containing protein [Dehalococcoidia bacterium]
MRIFDRHPRADLSSYADGELSWKAGERVEKHLASCAACREELALLRALRSALADLPEVSAPRSFALTPEMAARPAPAPMPAGPGPAFVAMRVAGAGVAAVLALVVFIDRDGGGSQFSGGDDMAALAPASESFNRSSDGSLTEDDDVAPDSSENFSVGATMPAQGLDASEDDLDRPADPLPADDEADGGVAGAAPTDVATATPAGLPPDVDGGTTAGGAHGTGGGSGGGAVPGAGPQSVTPTSGGQPTTEVELTVSDAEKSSVEDSIASDDSGDDATTEPYGLADGDDGNVSTMTVVQIALAVIAAGALAGGFVLPLFMRRN